MSGKAIGTHGHRSTEGLLSRGEVLTSPEALPLRDQSRASGGPRANPKSPDRIGTSLTRITPFQASGSGMRMKTVACPGFGVCFSVDARCAGWLPS